MAVLTSDVKPELREGWYDRQLRQGMQVCIAHPRLVSLGLDLLAFTDLIFWKTGYLLYTLRQASRRSWRIGQTEEVNVKYFAYADTAQETCLRLMGRKLLVELAMEGKFSTEGLQVVGEDDELLMAMARELVTEKGIEENAELVWQSIQEQNSAFARTTSAPTEPEHNAPTETELAPQEPLFSMADQLALFAASLTTTSGRKRSPRPHVPPALPGNKQLILF